MSYRVANVDELQDIAYRQDTHMRPVRHHMGISAFGTNAWTAANVGDRLMPEHREDPGIEELYAVLRGRARFEIEDETVDAGDYDAVIGSARETLEASEYAAPLYNLACCEALAGGHTDDAIGHLRVAFERRPSLRDLAKEDTDLDPLRDEPAFRELIGAPTL